MIWKSFWRVLASPSTCRPAQKQAKDRMQQAMHFASLPASQEFSRLRWTGPSQSFSCVRTVAQSELSADADEVR